MFSAISQAARSASSLVGLNHSLISCQRSKTPNRLSKHPLKFSCGIVLVEI